MFEPELSVCCESMRILAFGADSQCHIELNEEWKLTSCDDWGDRLPPLKFCPWCGKEIKP